MKRLRIYHAGQAHDRETSVYVFAVTREVEGQTDYW